MIEIAIFITVFIVGLLCGALGYSWFYKPDLQHKLQEELEKCQLENLQKQEDLQDYFSQSHRELHSLTEQISTLNKTWNAASQRFLEDSKLSRVKYSEPLITPSLKSSSQDLMELADEPAIDLLNEPGSEPSIEPFSSPSRSKVSKTPAP